MLTRCPACATHFRVTTEQLKARSGRVRCGECQQVFNALDSLLEEPIRVLAPHAAETSPPSVPADVTDMAVDVAAYSETTEDEAAVPPARYVLSETFEPMPEPLAETQAELSASPLAEQDLPIPEPAAAAEAAATEPATTQAATSAPDMTVAADTGVSGWSETFPAPPAPPRRWPWLIGSLVALAALGLQAVLAFRVELAVLWPEIRPALVALCDIADCEVGLPAKVALVGIEASDLHPDSGRAGRLALTATLKNRAPFAQTFPHLELTLTDTADKAIARKVLAPMDYLPPKTAFADGMQPNADIIVAVGVDPGEMTASGYRLYLFYP